MTQSCLDLIGADGRIIVEGPFALNRIYIAALASLTGREIKALPGSTGTSLGAALLTGISPKAPSSAMAPMLQVPALDAYRGAWKSRVADMAAAGPA
jgi:sugar (pentulose or hexulose) kinase